MYSPGSGSDASPSDGQTGHASTIPPQAHPQADRKAVLLQPALFSYCRDVCEACCNCDSYKYELQCGLGYKVQPCRASSRHCDNPIESDPSANIDWPLRVLNPISTPHLIRVHPSSQAVLNVSGYLSRADGTLRVPTNWTQCPIITRPLPNLPGRPGPWAASTAIPWGFGGAYVIGWGITAVGLGGYSYQDYIHHHSVRLASSASCLCSCVESLRSCRD